MPLVSLRLESWGLWQLCHRHHGGHAGIRCVVGRQGVQSPGLLWLGTANLMRLCLWAGAISIGLLAVLPSYPVWLVLRLMIGVILTIVFILGESWINQLVVEQWRGRLVALYGCTYALSQLSGAVVARCAGHRA
jgi:MFS family permease